MGLLDLIERGVGEVNSAAFRQVNRVRDWWELPLPAALLNLRAYRDDLREFNLYDTRAPSNGETVEALIDSLPKHRTYDGSLQDPFDPEMGRVGTRFGRNAPTDATAPEEMPQLLSPSPREVSRSLLHRDSFKPATSLNVLAACWIQFENHDWFGHGENKPDEFIDVPLPQGDDWADGDPMKVKVTHPDRTRKWKSGLPPTYVNTVTHWWDGSQIYGSDEERNRKLRMGEDGKMAIEDGRLPNEIEGNLDGSVLSADSVVVGVGCRISGDIHAREVIVGGTITGNVHASERVELQATAVVTGDVHTGSILIQEGGVVNGRVLMGPPGSSGAHGRPIETLEPARR